MSLAPASPSCRDRALAALQQHASSPTVAEDGMIAATLLAIGDLGSERIGRLLRAYLAYEPAYGRFNPFRYHWPTSALGEAADPSYDIGRHSTWWRPLETELRNKHRRGYARRLALAPVLGTQLELWSRVAADGGPHADGAAQLLAQAQPRVEDDIAVAIAATDPWADTFLLWQLTDHPRAFELVRGLLFTLAIRYGRIAERTDGIVHGTTFPFHATPLASATAHLGLGLWHFGLYPTLLPVQLGFLRSTERNGAWADGIQPPDVLTTLAAAELLARLDPAFDSWPTIRFFERMQEPDGWWRALDPEVPWLTAAILDWMRRSDLPFAERFRWPEVAVWQRDYITRLPTMAFFAGVADALDRCGGDLAAAPIEMAFCDLAGFGTFNTTYGQAAGDDALRAFGDALAATGFLVIRIGGDELIVLGRPTEQGALEPTLRNFLHRWPAELASRMAVPAGGVIPRIMLDEGSAGALRELHARLGRAIGDLKAATPEVPDRGVIVWR